MKRIMSILIAVLLCVFTPFTIFANAERIILDYQEFVTDVTVDGDNDIVTISIPMDYIFHRLYQTGTNEYTEVSNKRINFNAEQYSTSLISYRDEIHFTGYNYINAKDIPDDTIIKYKLKIGISQYLTNATGAFSALVRPYAIARGRDYALLTSNNYPENEGGIDSGVEKEFQTTFNKPNGTIYLDPTCSLTLFNKTDSSKFVYVDVTSVTMVLSINSLQRLQAETGRTNKLLQQIIYANEQQKENAEKTHSEVEENISSAEDVKNVLDEVSKLDPNDIGEQVDTFNVVTEEQIEEYTSIFGAILEAELVRNMLLVCISIALVSLILFGKKR